MSSSDSVTREQVLQNIEAEAHTLQAKQVPSVWPPPQLARDYEERLSQTIAELQARVEQERAALEQVCPHVPVLCEGLH